MVVVVVVDEADDDVPAAGNGASPKSACKARAASSIMDCSLNSFGISRFNALYFNCK